LGEGIDASRGLIAESQNEMKIRWHLMILVAVALLPVLIFAGVMIVALGRQERAAVERGLLDTARALSLAIDRELNTAIRSLQILALDDNLRSGDLKKFYDETKATLPALGMWENIILTDLSGQQLVNLRRPYGSLLPISDLKIIQQVVETGRPAVSDLFTGVVTGAPLIAVAVPVVRKGKVSYVLSTGADPKIMASLLAQQKIPSDRLATLVDRNKIIIARTRESEKFVGKPATQSFAAHTAAAKESVWRGFTLDGVDVFAAASRSDLSGWAIGLAVPVSIVEGALRRTALLTSLGAVALLVLGLFLAAVFGRRIAASFASLSAAAAALGRGEIPRVAALPIGEANQLARAFGDAAVSRKQAEERLQVSEERLSLALEGAGLGTWHYNVVTGDLIWSDKCREIFALPPDQALSYEVFLGAVHPEDRARVDRAVADSLGQKKDYAAEFRILQPDGSVRWITARGRGHYDDAGKPQHMEGIVRDISERRKGLEKIQNNIERLRALHEIETAIASILDLRGVLDILLEKIDLFTSYAAASVRLVNRETGELEPVAAWNIDEEKWKKTFSRTPGGLSQVVLESKTPVMIPNIVQDKRTRHNEFMREHGLVSFLGIPLIAKDETLGVLAAFTKEPHRFDAEEVEFLTTLGGQAAIAIHNAQIYEEMVRANKVKEEFLSVMSHELRTPLSVVMGYTGMLKEGMMGEVNPQQQEALQKILSRAADQLQMINSIMQTTQLETRAAAPERLSVNLPELLTHLRSDLDMTRSKKDVALLWDYPLEPLHIVTDGGKLRQILQNLVGNALKFTDQGNVTVSARMVESATRKTVSGERDGKVASLDDPLPPAGHYLQIKVADTGIGIPEEQVPSIFEKFFQVDSSETRLYGGVGLGLYIVKTFTQLLGGRVEVENNSGGGSVFTVTIPVELPAGPPAKISSQN
jgi:PAS domain S-box-containing protein